MTTSGAVTPAANLRALAARSYTKHSSDFVRTGGRWGFVWACLFGLRSPDQQNEFSRFAPIEGWIELGLYIEAAEELNNLSPTLKSTPGFCKLWVRIYAATDAWANVEMMCQTLVANAPDDPFGHSYLAESLHRQERSDDAALFLARGFDAVAPTDMPEYHYALARYRCGEGKIDLAGSELAMALRLDPSLRWRALDDPELERIWLNWSQK